MRYLDGASARTRTVDQLIKSQLLYQLSYRGNRLAYCRNRAFQRSAGGRFAPSRTDPEPQKTPTHPSTAAGDAHVPHRTQYVNTGGVLLSDPVSRQANSPQIPFGLISAEGLGKTRGATGTRTSSTREHEKSDRIGLPGLVGGESDGE